MRGIVRVDSHRPSTKVEGSTTGGHRFKGRGGKFRGDVRGKFFTQMVVGVWTALPV